MARWKIELRNVGPDRATGTILVDAENLVKAKRHAIQMCRRHLSARGDIYLEARGQYRYCIVAGMDDMGEATITGLDGKQGRTHRGREVQEPNPRKA
jgi:hypothetical protein